VWRGENQAVTQANIPDPVTGLAATEAVAPACPDLQFMTAFHGTCLGVSERRAQEGGKEQGGECSFH